MKGQGTLGRKAEMSFEMTLKPAGGTGGSSFNKKGGQVHYVLKSKRFFFTYQKTWSSLWERRRKKTVEI